MAPFELSRLARILIDLSDNSILHWASICGFEAANASAWLRGREEKLSEKNVVRLLKALSLDPDTLSLDPSRIHVWFVAVHEPDTLADAADAFLRPPVEMALVAPDPDGPATFSQGPQLALVRARDLRVILVRKLFTTKMSENHVPKTPGTPWIGPSAIPGARWRAREIPPTEDAPPILVPGPVMIDLAKGNVSLEVFDALFDQAAPWDWDAVLALARESGLTARDVANLIKKNR